MTVPGWATAASVRLDQSHDTEEVTVAPVPGTLRTTVRGASICSSFRVTPAYDVIDDSSASPGEPIEKCADTGTSSPKKPEAVPATSSSPPVFHTEGSGICQVMDVSGKEPPQL